MNQVIVVHLASGHKLRFQYNKPHEVYYADLTISRLRSKNLLTRIHFETTKEPKNDTGK